MEPVRLNTEPQYFVDGDFMTRFLEQGLYYADQIDEYLTLYRSEVNHEIIGYKIAGFSVLFEAALQENWRK